MITELHIRNFQSIRKADLDLGLFTVIVGPSSSGKSALIRACKALASNVRGAGVITRGQKQMAITARTDQNVISLEREERGGLYRLTGVDGSGEVFTKLGGDVPARVTEVLRIEPVGDGGSVNFAGQFDKPYLLDESGSTVARVLGELTNVNQIFEAVRTANRVRSNAASTLKTRKTDLDQVRVRLGAFQGLSERISVLHEVEQLDVDRRFLESQIERLDIGVRKLRITERLMAEATPPDVPPVEPLNDALNQYLDLQGKLRGIVAKQKTYTTMNNAVTELDRLVSQLQQELNDTLAAAGVCPTCGQEIHS